MNAVAPVYLRLGLCAVALFREKRFLGGTLGMRSMQRRAVCGVAVLLAAAATSSAALTLGVNGSQFTLDGKPSYLLGISYYGGIGAEEEFIREDLEGLGRAGFNWIRVWATWSVFDHDVSAVAADGSPRPEWLDRLKGLVAEADRRGFVVDVTLSRGEWLPTMDAHLKAVRTLAEALKPYRNVYIDVANERNVRDARYVSFQELRRLRDAIKQLDPDRLMTASQGGDISQKELGKYLFEAQVDFICPHRPRQAKSPAETADATRRYLARMRDAGRSVPVHYQEPFRRGYGHWQPGVEDFVVDERGARSAGAAGWCLHNGSRRGAEGERPRRCFDMRRAEGGLLRQLDEVELGVIERLRGAYGATGRRPRGGAFH